MRVLLIDDCPETRAAWLESLHAEGHLVLEAHDALAGLQRAIEEHPERILVAAGLAGLSADEVCDGLAREPVTAGIPRALVTAPSRPARRAA